MARGSQEDFSLRGKPRKASLPPEAWEWASGAKSCSRQRHEHRRLRKRLSTSLVNWLATGASPRWPPNGLWGWNPQRNPTFKSLFVRFCNLLDCFLSTLAPSTEWKRPVLPKFVYYSFVHNLQWSGNRIHFPWTWYLVLTLLSSISQQNEFKGILIIPSEHICFFFFSQCPLIVINYVG